MVLIDKEKIYLNGEKGKGKFALIDDSDYEEVSKYKWYLHNAGYAKTNTGIYLHRLVMKVNDDRVIDHININPLDNRKCNLRICLPKENSRNRGKNSFVGRVSQYKGVSMYKRNLKKLWYSRIKFNYKTYCLGDYFTEEEAAKAYDKKAKELFGNFAVLNFN